MCISLGARSSAETVRRRRKGRPVQAPGGTAHVAHRALLRLYTVPPLGACLRSLPRQRSLELVLAQLALPTARRGVRSVMRLR